MRVTSRGVLHDVGMLGGVWTLSDALRSPLLVLTLLGCSVCSDSPEKPTAGSECVQGSSWMLAEMGVLGVLLGTIGTVAERPRVMRTLGDASESRRLLENAFGSAFGAFCAISEGTVGPRASTVDARALLLPDDVSTPRSWS